MLYQLSNVGIFDGLVRRPPVLYARIRKFLAIAETWDGNERDAWLKARLHHVTALAQRLPGYRQRAADDQLSAWPILERGDVAGNELAFSRPTRLPAHRAATGGTTGVPLAILRSPYSIVFEQASIDHICVKAGLDLPRARMAVLRGDFVKPPSDSLPPYWRSVGPRKRIFSSFHLSRRTLPDYLKGFHEFNPDILICYPSSLQHLLNLIVESRETFRINHVLTSSECMPQKTVETARQVLGARVIDYYGQAERVVFAYAIDGGGYYFLPGYGATELRGDTDNRVRILGTSLWNDRQVFVRYDTGDFARLTSTTKSTLRDIEMGLLPFSGIDGRSSERIDLPDGRRIIGLNHLPRGVPGVVSIQFRHAQPDTIEAFVVPSNEYSPKTEIGLRRNFYEKFPSNIVLRVSRVEAPIRSPSGKASLLIR